MAERPFPEIDLELPDEQLAEWLESVLNQRVQVDDQDRTSVTISCDEQRLLQQWSHSAGSNVRKLAAEFLFDKGPCSWEDLESWALDSDEDVRYVVVRAVTNDYEAGGKLCCLDKQHCIELLVRAARRYTDDWQPEIAFQMAATEDSEWLELTWQAANSLLNDDDPELNTALFCCYFEHVIPDLGWDSENPHIVPWVSGNDVGRQRILLLVATYRGLDVGRLRDIVQALTHAKDKEIAAVAKGVLEGRVAYGSF